MKQARVKKLATEGHLELTRKMFQKLVGRGVELDSLAGSVAKGEIDEAPAFLEPDDTFIVKQGKKKSDEDLVCVQTHDGKMVRIVGVIKKG
ncbi:MAG: hypothetical protein CL946_05270 [Ectothiorhodospiraceae bacterium]|nr:hypothetical protein [Ectothiorhodospiraceae bacterium]